MKLLLTVFLACAPAIVAQSVDTTKQLVRAIAPALLHKVEADYTTDARAKGIEGVARLYVEIDRNGIPGNIRVVKSVEPGLDAQAVEALKQWRFRPAERDGKAVVASATIEFLFRLSRFSAFQDPALKPAAEEPVDGDSVIWW